MHGVPDEWRTELELGRRALFVGFLLGSLRLRGLEERSRQPMIRAFLPVLLPSDNALLDGSEWSESKIQDLLWQVECLHVLLWTGGKLDALPPTDEQADPTVIVDHINEMSRAPDAWLRTLRLRNGDELARHYERFYFWLWRARSGPRKGTRILPPAVAENVERALRDGRIVQEEVAEGDVIAFGKPFFRLDEDEQGAVGEILFERSRAIRWLSGDFDDWWDPELDTVVM